MIITLNLIFQILVINNTVFIILTFPAWGKSQLDRAVLTEYLKAQKYLKDEDILNPKNLWIADTPVSDDQLTALFDVKLMIDCDVALLGVDIVISDPSNIVKNDAL